MVWLSNQLRRDFRTASESVAERNKFAALEIEQLQSDLHSAIDGQPIASPSDNWGTLRQSISAYLRSRNIVHLSEIQKNFDGQLLRLLDQGSGQAHLIARRGDALAWVCSLQPGREDDLTHEGALPHEVVERFIRRRHTCLLGALL